LFIFLLDICLKIEWFAAKKLFLNLDKMNITKFKPRISSHSALCIGYKEKYVEETVNTKFLGLQTENHINWKKKLSPIEVQHVML
jgi:hypothetical protein